MKMKLISVKVSDKKVRNKEKEFVHANIILANIEKQIDDENLNKISTLLSKLMISQEGSVLGNQIINLFKKLYQSNQNLIDKNVYADFLKTIKSIAE